MAARPILAGGHDRLPGLFTVMAVIVEGFAVALVKESARV
jgi:hypothetical protein